ncbi:MAG: SUMF1/EgtB/PvdO family nonheme iron enzyme [Oscillochloridaceae bacterium]|nr:SUMF1/EgtB/PvdO family nonheme iron enzyme [Chloroflexaceae bacterium]MDW8391047.1 SUMF1/EgtB/PvdO family nonheme iron enzyme [Oscillochloridaceae bacterium]
MEARATLVVGLLPVQCPRPAGACELVRGKRFLRLAHGAVHDALPAGHALRLPTAAEWEVAAAWDGGGGYRVYPWGDAPPTPERAIFGDSRRERPTPVGGCPAGAAACGALDMAGNVRRAAGRGAGRARRIRRRPERRIRPGGAGGALPGMLRLF